MLPAQITAQKNGIPHFIWWGLFLAAPLLLLLGGVGVFRLFAWAAEAQIDQDALFEGLALAVLPLLLFAFLSAAIAINYVRSRAFLTAQSALAGLQNRQSYHQDFIRIIADSRPGSTLIVDGEGRLWFVNTQAAASIKMPPQQAVGLQFEKVFPEEDVLRLKPMIRMARTRGAVAEQVNRIKQGTKMHYVKSQVVPLPSTANMSNAVMINEDDITNLLVEREARERMFRQVIDTLVAVVDRRDPYATGHSVRVGQMARAIALDMRLESAQVETAEIAGLLMNFGKVLVPREILIKAAALSPDELKQVHQSLLTSADILALIGFVQPVVPTLRQVLEHYDGSGAPNGLRGEEIMITARIVIVANAFVALLSPRAHRPGLDVASALEALMKNSDRIYDRRVVEVLTACVAARRHSLEWLPAA